MVEKKKIKKNKESSDSSTEKTIKKANNKKTIKTNGTEEKKSNSQNNKDKPKVINQPEVNIGLVGHVDHGKTTLTERLSGKWTDTHSEEVKRGITIKLGYADSTFYKCPKCQQYTVKPKCHDCGGEETKKVRTVSFVDAPGHESLMATMLAGATVMDGAILLIAANELCPQPQTREHLMALQMAGIKNIVIAQNKIDLLDDERTLKNYKQIKEFLKDTEYKDAPIIPISAQRGINIHFLIQAIEEQIKTPERDPTKEPFFLVARSFDINKPGHSPSKLVGGILGGALKQGILKKGERIEIRPGRILEEANQLVNKPIFTTIESINSGGESYEEITPGGSMGIMTKLDPAVVKSDSLVGNIIGHPDKLPPVWYDLVLEANLLERVVGSQEEQKVDPIKMHEILMLNVNSAATVGQVVELAKNKAICKLRLPVCAEIGARVAISRRVGTRFRLIGYGIITKQ
ncbi:translation initiation factor IF-2 subunit gamma [Candidatus Woesearchaeota archaeon]|nr:translation initiation factor IF-2 subunit gamma [Candidatus Woesearchaeota archaeon]MCF7901498.1 translation initiation factor IF-2 subunit gamma [Candidatus Woesearchaeota archaeon]MCF8013920.1 translation initiation factor IF-2 subunit gamma [Candidatus Woesearchaeota archaeon]